MITSDNISALQQSIINIDVFLKKALMERIKSSTEFEIMRDCPELLGEISKLQGFAVLMTPESKDCLDNVVSSMESEINRLLDCFRDAISARTNDPIGFNETSALETINNQHRRLSDMWELNVAVLLQSLQSAQPMPGVTVGLSGPSVDVVEWWNWLRKKQ